MNSILAEDINLIGKSDIIDWSLLDNSSVLVTGATGLIGSQVVLGIDKHNELFGTNITVYALVRNEEKAKKIFADCTDKVMFVKGDVREKINIDGKLDYIIHGASATSSKFFVDNPVETIMIGMEGTNNVLSLAKEKNVKGFLYMSSLEIYGVTDPSLPTVKENAYGFIEQLSPRSSYSEGKRMAECLCISYGSEYNVPVKIARLCQTFGPGVEYADGRVFAQFARSAIEGNDIVLKTKGETFRNYCYTKDAIIGIIKVLLEGNNNEAYNIANPNTAISICDMAEMVCSKIADNKIKVVFDIAEDVEKLGYNPTIKIKLDTSKIEGLGWKATVDLQEAFTRMIDYMVDTK